MGTSSSKLCIEKERLIVMIQKMILKNRKIRKQNGSNRVRSIDINYFLETDF